MMHGRDITRVTTPAPPPVSLDDRIDPVRAALFVGGAVLGAALFGVGVAVCRLGLASSAEARDLGGWAWLFVGAAVALAGAAVWALAMWALWALVSYEIAARRIWQDQILHERRAAGGLVTEERVSEWALRVDDPRHLLLAAIGIYWQARYAGESTPWSVRSLRRLELVNRRGSTLLGTCTEDQARALGDQLVRAGILTGRGPRAAGDLAVSNADELLERIVPLLRAPPRAHQEAE